VLLSLLVLAGCGGSEPSDPAPEVEGSWVLTGYGTLTVPANVTELPVSPQDPTPSGCFSRITRGSLTLSKSTHLFWYGLEFLNTCTGNVLSRREAQGSFRQSGRSIEFTLASGETFTGAIEGSEIRLNQEPALRFEK
jgi:hypothetical protein